MTLRDRGWVECGTCEGEGGFYDDSMTVLGIPGGVVPSHRCEECVEGLVPPDDQVVAAADALAKATFDRQWVQGRGREWWNTVYEQVTVALVAAARKEKGCP